MRLLQFCSAAAFLSAMIVLHAQAADAPRVVASIKPVHSLVAGVMEGVGEPHLLVGGGDSPHTYAMRPSDAAALAEADAVFLIGYEFEAFLERPIANLGSGIRAVTLIDAHGIVLHRYDEDADVHDHDGHARGSSHAHEPDHGHGDAHHDADAHHGGHEHGDTHRHEDGHAGEGDHVHEGTDGHIWLDPANARIMVDAIEDSLAEIDPDNAQVYAANAAALKKRLEALEADLAARLEPYAGVPFFTFHDAFRYFSERFGLDSRGAITLSPERQPGARRLGEIRADITRLNRVCVFAEPQFPPSLVDTVVEGTGASTGVIDPLGAEISSGPELYFELMTYNAEAFRSCFSDTM